MEPKLKSVLKRMWEGADTTEFIQIFVETDFQVHFLAFTAGDNTDMRHEIYSLSETGPERLCQEIVREVQGWNTSLKTQSYHYILHIE